MVDQFLFSLKEISETLIPVVSLVALVLLALVLYRIYIVIKNLPTSIDKVNDILEQTQTSMEKLDEPLTTVQNLSQSVDKINEAGMNAFQGIVSFAADHSDQILDAVKGVFSKDKKAKKTKAKKEEIRREDFGVYDD